MNVEIEAAEALLDDGVSVPFKRLRIPFVKRPIELRMVMRRPCLGSQIRIAKHYLALGTTYEQMKTFTVEQDMEFVVRHGKRISKMIALTVCRGPVSGRILAPAVAFFIRWFVEDIFIQGANTQFIILLGTKNFTNIIRSAELSNPMKPRLSQKTQGS
jgi:hypothetical protein